MIEIWKTVKNFNAYEISNLGNVRSSITKKELKQRENNRGYRIIELYDIGIRKTALVHRLVAEAFIPIPNILKNEKRLQVNHKDGIKNNNNLNNLEWCNQSYNMKEAYKLGLRKYVPHTITNEYREKMRKLSLNNPSPGKEIQMLNIDGNIISIFESAADAVRKRPDLKLNASTLRDAINKRRGRSQFYKGYIWKETGKITNKKKKDDDIVQKRIQQ